MTNRIEWDDRWWHSDACILASWRVGWFGTFWLCGEGISMDVSRVRTNTPNELLSTTVARSFAPTFSRKPRRSIAELNGLTPEQLRFLVAGGAT